MLSSLPWIVVVNWWETLCLPHNLFGMQLELLNMDPAFLNRNVNEGFSGGEKKRNEILQLAVLEVSNS